MAFEGSCHCGAVTFEVDADMPTEAMSCNCSHCSRKGFLLSFVPEETFTLKSGDGKLREYLFNKHTIRHQFCETCGCEGFALGTMPNGARMIAVNLRCIPEVDPEALVINKVDGASF